MTNPATPPKSGMPKWLIVLLVIFIILAIGCCGGLAACHWACNRVVATAQEKGKEWADEGKKRADEAKRQTEEEAKRQAEEEAKRQAEQNGVPIPGGTGGGTSTPGASAGGNTRGNGAITPAIPGTKVPASFPKDIPLMPGLVPSAAIWDNLKESGWVNFATKSKPEDVVAYFEKQLKDQGWTETQNNSIGTGTVMEFTKNSHKATLLIAPGDDGLTAATITYEPKP